MAFWDRLLARPAAPGPRASAMPGDGGTLITTSAELEAAIRGGAVSGSGQLVNAETAMRIGAVYACVRLIAGAVATTPIKIMRRVDERTRIEESDNDLWTVLRRRPNRWQKPATFRRMLQAHVLLRGNGYALIGRGALGGVRELVPLHPDRVKVRQRDDLTLEYVWTRKDGRQIPIEQRDMLHLVGLTLDGINGVTPISYARETLGAALALEQHHAKVLSNGARVSGALKAPPGTKLSDAAYNNLKRSIEDYRQGGDKEGAILLLEDGLDFVSMSMSPTDLQYIEARKLSRSDIAMFYGVPPSMIGDNSGSDSNWGTGLEQKKDGFATFTLEDHYTMWEEALTADCLDDPDLFAKFNRAAQLRGDVKTRTAGYTAGRNGGWLSINDIRGLEDMNPIEGGDDYAAPLNSNAKPATSEETADDARAKP